MCLIFRRSGGDGGRRWRAAPGGAARAASRTARRGRGSSRRSSRRCARCGFARSWASSRAARRSARSTARGRQAQDFDFARRQPRGSLLRRGTRCPAALSSAATASASRRRAFTSCSPDAVAQTSEVVSGQQAADHAVGRMPRTSASWVTMARNARSPRSVMLQRIAFGQVKRRPEGRVAAAPQT